MTKVVSSILFIAYLLLIPSWILNSTWYHFLIAYLTYWFLTDIILGAFMHRWAAHKLWNPPIWFQKFASIIGVVGLIGSPIGWSAWHRTHHAKVDSKDDPHSPKFKSIFFITFLHKFHSAESRRAIDQLRNNYFMFLYKHEMSFIILGNLILFVLLPWQWFLTLWAVPLSLMIFNINFFVNFLLHRKGYAEDNVLLWPIIFSEIYHKKHHDDPKLSYNKWDISAWIIKNLKWQNV